MEEEIKKLQEQALKKIAETNDLKERYDGGKY